MEIFSEVKKHKLFIKIKPPFVRIYNHAYIWSNRFWINLINLFNILCMKKPKVMTIEESIDYIISNKCSLSRFGDGEMNLIMGNKLQFQDYSKQLADRLEEVLQSNDLKHIVGIPDVFGSLKKYEGLHKRFWQKNIYENRMNWYKYINKEKKYVNAFISRCYMNYKNKESCGVYFELVKTLWKNKDIVIVEGEKSRLGIGNDLFDGAKSINRILCPVENAFSVYDNILKEVKKVPHYKIILIALGPTATVLAYDLSKIGYQAIDIGHIDIEYEWYLQKSKNKVKIEKKYVNEVEEGWNVEEIQDEKYLKQVICSIL